MSYALAMASMARHMMSGVSSLAARSTLAAGPSPTAFLGFAAKAGATDILPKVKEGVRGEQPSILDQATGLERAEIEYPDLFKHNEVLRGPFGTPEAPVKIQSAYDSRIVGCTGHAAPDDHDLVWITVKKGEIAYCPICGQAFELVPL